MREDWIEVELVDVCHFEMGQSPPSSTYNKNGKGVPFFQGKAEFTDKHPIVQKWCTAPKKTAKANDILMSVRAPVGATNIANINCAIGRGLAAISYPYSTEYLWYYLRLSERILDEKGTGTTFKAISGSILKSHKFPLAPLPEQRAIVAKIEQLFSELDHGIANLNAAKTKLEIYRQAVLKKAFEDGFGIRTNSQEWRIAEVSELCEVVRGGSPRPAGDGRFYDGSIPFLKVADLTRNKGVYLTSHTFSIKEAGLSKTRYVDKGTLLLSNSGATLGVPKICTFPTTFNDGIAAFLGLDKNATLYHYYYWCSRTIELRGINQGAAQPNLNTNLIGSCYIPVGPINEMIEIVREIESRLSVCDNILVNIEEGLEKSEALRQSILKQAFEGKLLSEGELAACRKEADWEPAEQLLARIKEEKRTGR